VLQVFPATCYICVAFPVCRPGDFKRIIILK
jgi:hypothetical protein